MARPDSIQEKGLEAYLEQTKSEHNDLAYADFVRYITERDEFDRPYPKMHIATAFKVTRETLYKWLRIYELEQEEK